MIICKDKHSIIGEGPVWNERENRLYVTNGFEKEILIYDIYSNSVVIRKTPVCCAAICFSEDNRLIVSHSDGVDILNSDNTLSPIYDKEKYKILNANDMKVGPDGRIYVGTQSSKRLGISNEIDGRLYSVDWNGTVTQLLDGLILSNGLAWSADEKRFYHTDSDTGIIREYEFNLKSGGILFTGRSVEVAGVDGFTTAPNGRIYAACWGYGHIAVISTAELKIEDYIKLPAVIPASCSFVGKNSEFLAVTTATYGLNEKAAENDGALLLCDIGACGKKPYLFRGTEE